MIPYSEIAAGIGIPLITLGLVAWSGAMRNGVVRLILGLFEAFALLQIGGGTTWIDYAGCGLMGLIYAGVSGWMYDNMYLPTLAERSGPELTPEVEDLFDFEEVEGPERGDE